MKRPEIGVLFTEQIKRPDRLLCSVCFLIDNYSYVELFRDGTLLHQKNININEFRIINDPPFKVENALLMSDKLLEFSKKALKKK